MRVNTRGTKDLKSGMVMDGAGDGKSAGCCVFQARLPSLRGMTAGSCTASRSRIKTANNAQRRLDNDLVFFFVLETAELLQESRIA